MKKQLIAGVVGVVMALSAGVAMADRHRVSPPKAVVKKQNQRQHQIEKRIDRQEVQIKRGMREGRLLRREAAFLNENLRGVKRSYQRANRDRRIDRAEWRKLNFLLERNGRIISCLKNSPPPARHYRYK